MIKRYFLLLGVCVCAVFMIADHNAAQRVNGLPTKVPSAGADELQSKGKLKVDVDFAKIPLYFIANQGQVNAKARFYARASRYTLWLTREGLIFDEIKKQDAGERKHDSPAANDQWPMTNDNSSITTHHSTNLPLTNHQSPFTSYGRDVSRLLFIGANENPGMKAVKPAALKVNYFIGNDRSKWRCDVPTALAVRYENLYKNIDLEVYGVEKQIEYDWVVRPGGDAAAIAFEYKGVKGTRIDEEGNLVIETRFGELIHQKPVSYQVIDSKKQAVAAYFKKIGPDRYGFSVGSYDKSYELIIDPVVLAYSTYLRGSGGEEGFGIDADDSGNVYVTGWTGSSDFPIKNEFMTDPSTGNREVFVSKIDTTKSGTASLIYSTYLGGFSGSETGFGIFADDMGNAYVCGNTGSSDFPIKNQYMTYSGYEDAFVTKLDTTKSGAASLVYSTYLGGSLDDHCRGITVDKSGNVYVTGWTYSADFPTKNQYMSDPGDSGHNDAFVSKIDATASGAACLVYSTYLGGSNYEGGAGIAADGMGIVYVSGSTNSVDFPCKNAYMVDPGDNNNDAFVAKLDTTQSGAACLLYSTYLAGSNNDYGGEIVVDSSGYVYLTGKTGSPDFPTKNEYMIDPGDNAYDVFLCKIDASQSGADSLLFSTYFGGSGGDYGVDIGMDSSGNVYFTGCTVSSDLPMKAHYMDYPGPGFNFYVTKMDINKSGDDILVYSTYLGGSEEDHCMGIAVDKNGSAYVTGVTYSTDYPTKNAYLNAPLYEAYSSVFITKLSLVEGVLVTAPNGGENWRMGSTQNITWLTADVSNLLKITLWKDGTQLGVIADNIDPALETYPWTAGNYSGGAVAPGAGYAVKIKEIGTTASDASNESFTISALTVTSPNGGENWKLGSNHDITWNAAGVSGLLKITLWKDGVQSGVIADNIAAASGFYAWTAGKHSGGMAAPGAGYTIKIKEAGTTLTDTSDAAFTLSPGITITSPNGGEAWVIGSARNITWKSGGLSNPVKITLWKDGALVGTITANVNPAVGSYTWKVGNYIGGTATAGTGYTIKIKEIDATVTDSSDAPFQLTQ